MISSKYYKTFLIKYQKFILHLTKYIDIFVCTLQRNVIPIYAFVHLSLCLFTSIPPIAKAAKLTIAQCMPQRTNKTNCHRLVYLYICCYCNALLSTNCICMYVHQHIYTMHEQTQKVRTITINVGYHHINGIQFFFYVALFFEINSIYNIALLGFINTVYVGR